MWSWYSQPHRGCGCQTSMRLTAVAVAVNRSITTIYTLIHSSTFFAYVSNWHRWHAYFFSVLELIYSVHRYRFIYTYTVLHVFWSVRANIFCIYIHIMYSVYKPIQSSKFFGVLQLIYSIYIYIMYSVYTLYTYTDLCVFWCWN